MRTLIYSFVLLILGFIPLVGQDAQISRGTRNERPKGRTQTTQISPLNTTQAPKQNSPETLERLTWQKTLYRKLSLAEEANAVLAYPQRADEERHNLLSLLFQLIAEGRINAYEYIDGEERFIPKYKLNFDELISRFGLAYKSPEDSPSELVKAYYIKEQNYFNQANSRLGRRVLALCPILYDLGDYGEVPKPLFWVRYADIKPYLQNDVVQLSSDNEAMRGTLADFFDLSLYHGEIVKTQTLTGKSLAELSRDSTELKARQAKLEAELKVVQESLSLPDSLILRSSGQAPPTKKIKRQSSAKVSKAKNSSKANSRTKPTTPSQLSARGLS